MYLSSLYWSQGKNNASGDRSEAGTSLNCFPTNVLEEGTTMRGGSEGKPEMEIKRYKTYFLFAIALLVTLPNTYGAQLITLVFSIRQQVNEPETI